MAVAVLCIFDAVQSTPVAPKRSLDSTEMYYLAHDSDDATSSYKPLTKKARTSNDAAGASPQHVRRPSVDLNKVPSTHSLDSTELYSGARLPFEDGATSAHKHLEKGATPSSSSGSSSRQQVGSPSSSKASSNPPSSRHSTSETYESHSWNEKQSEPPTNDVFWHTQVPRRPRSSRARKGARGEASHSSLKTEAETHANALQTEYFDHRGVGSLTMAPGKLWHEPREVMDIYSTRGVIKAKALAIQEHVPGYPTSPKEYNFKSSGLMVKNRQLHRQRQTTGHNKHVRKTYTLMAKNQDKGLPLLKGVPLMLAKDVNMAARKRKPILPPGTILQDYRTLLSDDGKRDQVGGECSGFARSDGR